MSDSLHTVLVGFGKIAAGYADDLTMRRVVPFATHAHVLAVHPAFRWDAVVDPSDDARAAASSRWNIPLVVPTVADLPTEYQPDVAILATPATVRFDVVRSLRSLRGVLVEKPIAETISDGEQLVRYCATHRIVLQVNLPRRADATFQRLRDGWLHELIGRPQAVFGVYGNGLENNGTHMVDLVRMLAGEIVGVQAAVPDGRGDRSADPAFTLFLEDGGQAMFQPLAFRHFRENGLDIWGERGRLSILHEGLTLQLMEAAENRSMASEREIASDRPRAISTTMGHALYRMYDDLAAAMRNERPPCSSGDEALSTARVLEAVRQSLRGDGAFVRVGDGLLA